MCVPGVAVYNVTLAKAKANAYQRFGQVSNIQECLDKVCAKKDGDMAYLLNNFCYSIKCYDVGSCETASLPFVQDMQSILVDIKWKGELVIYIYIYLYRYIPFYHTYVLFEMCR